MCALLKYCPTTYVYIGKGGSVAFGLSRVPKEHVHVIQDALIKAAHEEGLKLRFVVPSRMLSYTRTIYQRLLNEDGTWDDDVSDFLEQARM
jgi:hypothetical protein